MSNIKTSASSDYNSWRNTLIAVVQKHGYTTNRIPGWTGTTVSAGQNMTSGQMTNITNDMIKTSQTLCHIPAFSTLDIGDYSVGKPTLLVTKTKIEAKLNEMYNVCHHDNHDSYTPCAHNSPVTCSDCCDDDDSNYGTDNQDRHNTGDSGDNICDGVYCDGYTYSRG